MKKFKRKVLAMLMTNNFGSSLRQQLFDSAPFCSELLYTAIPQRAASGTTATFTRATTSTWPNNDGYMVTGVAGEIGFVGARRVRNLLTFTEDFSNAAWTKINGGAGSAPTVTSGFTDPDGGTTAWRLQANRGGNAGGDYSIVRQAHTSGNCRAIYAKSNTGATQEIYFGAANGPADKVSVTTEWTRVSNPNVANNLTDIGSYGATGNATQSIDILIWHPQCEDVTAQTTQTAGEYVSVGVASAPYYHGSMVDGVKCFPTDLSGNPIPSTTMLGYQAQGARTNVLTYSNDLSNAAWVQLGTVAPVQNTIGIDGALSAWTLTDDDGASTEVIYQATTKTAATWTESCYVKKTSGAQSSYPVLYAFDGATRVALCTIDTTNGTATVWTAYTGLTVQTSVARCRSYNADKWFVELSFTATAAAGWRTSVAPAATTNATQSTGVFNTAATGSAVIERLQSELGSFASSYIPTTTAAVTRDADVLTYSGGDVPNLKTLMAGFRREVGVSSLGIALSINDNTTTNYEDFRLNSDTVTQFIGISGGVVQWATGNIPYTPGTTGKAAWSAATNSIKTVVSGTAGTEDTSATMPTVTQLSVGHITDLYQLDGNVGPIYGWTRNLSQSELNAVTS